MLNNILSIFKNSFICIFLLTAIFNSYSMTTQEKAIAFYEKNLTSYFRNIDFNGNVFFIQNICGFKTSKSFIYLHVKFNSSSINRSPYVGYGWSIPFFESSIYPFADGLYVLNMPDGYVKIFIQDRKKPNLLFSRGGWQATITKDVVIAHNFEQKLTYKSGHLINLKTKDYNLKFQYNQDGVVEKIKEDHKVILEITRNGTTTTITKLGEAPIILSMSKRYVPKLKNNVFSLSKINFLKTSLNFEYLFDTNNDPQLKTDSYIFTWDAKTNLAKRVNDYCYNIKSSPSNIVCSAAITEHLPKYERPDIFWQKNDFSGIEVYEAYGVKNITTSFVSGMLKGKKRKIEQYFQGKLLDKYEYSYNDKGKINRIISLKSDWIYIYESDGKTLAAKILNGVLFSKLTPNASRLAKPFLEKSNKKITNKGN